MKGISNFIEKEFIKSRKEKEIALRVDGKPIPMTPFVKDFIRKTVNGMLSALRGCETSKHIEIYIEGKER
jgi:molybdopterin-guanine dinucleotide biosynthesis protein B